MKMHMHQRDDAMGRWDDGTIGEVVKHGENIAYIFSRLEAGLLSTPLCI